MYGVYTRVVWVEGTMYEAIGVVVHGDNGTPDVAMMYCANPDIPIIFMENGVPVDHIDNAALALLIPAFHAIGDDCQTYLGDPDIRNDFWWLVRDTLDKLNEKNRMMRKVVIEA